MPPAAFNHLHFFETQLYPCPDFDTAQNTQNLFQNGLLKRTKNSHLTSQTAVKETCFQMCYPQFPPFLLFVLYASLNVYTPMQRIYTTFLFPCRWRGCSVLFKVPSWHHQGAENLQRRQTAKGEKPCKPTIMACHEQVWQNKGLH